MLTSCKGVKQFNTNAPLLGLGVNFRRLAGISFNPLTAKVTQAEVSVQLFSVTVRANFPSCDGVKSLFVAPAILAIPLLQSNHWNVAAELVVVADRVFTLLVVPTFALLMVTLMVYSMLSQPLYPLM